MTERNQGVPVPSAGERLAAAMQRHQAGQFAEAEAIYGELLRAQPNHPDALHLLGLLSYQTGRGEAAVQLLERAVLANPAAAAFHYDLGAVLASIGRPAEAIERYQHALSVHPTYFEALYNLGGLLATAGRIEEAVQCYRRALALQPLHAQSHLYLGILLSQLGRSEEAARVYQEAIALQPGYVEAHNNLGNTLKALGKFDEAEASYRRALALRPDLAALHNNLGGLFQDQGRYEEAVAAYEHAVALEPDAAEALSNLGSVLASVGRFDEAERYCRRALEVRPDDAQAHVHLGNVFEARGETQRAEASYRQALAIDPEHADALSNLGGALGLQGRAQEALESYRQALRRRPDSANAHLGLALLALQQGDLVRGWEEYEWRERMKDAPRTGGAFRSGAFREPRWDGQPLDGRRVLLYAEQGFGDTLQFVRYAPLVAAKGGCVILEVQPELVSLLRQLERIDGIDAVLSSDAPRPPFDVQAPLLSLPYLFETRLETIPALVPYLRADPALVAHWREELERRLAAQPGIPPTTPHVLRVGLAWAGTPKNANDRVRSLTLAQLAPLAAIEGAQFISLQKGPAAGAAAMAAAPLPLLNLGPDLRDFADTAAVLETLDLLITVDTAVGHLAGALGRPFWELLSFVPDWRWLLEREDSPWYPTAWLVRQDQDGEWSAPLQRVVAALRERRDAKRLPLVEKA